MLPGKKIFQIFAIGAAMQLSTVVAADPWEPGFNLQFDYSFSGELQGQTGNSMEGSLLGLGFNYSTESMFPVRVSLKYREGTSDHRGDPQFQDAEADNRVLDFEFSVGRSFDGVGIEVIPFVGLGVRDFRQSFSSGSVAPNNDIVTSARKHRLLYVPIGFYTGSNGPLEQVNIFYNISLKPVIAGEASIGNRSSSAKMVMNSGYGLRLEGGFHIPSTRTWTVFTSVYFEQWDIKSSERGIRGRDNSSIIERETGTKSEEIGVTLGVQF